MIIIKGKIKKTTKAKCKFRGEELLGPQARFRVTPIVWFEPATWMTSPPCAPTTANRPFGKEDMGDKTSCWSSPSFEILAIGRPLSNRLFRSFQVFNPQSSSSDVE